MERGGTELHTLAGAYALDAVSDADRARFEQHLARCAECVQEIRGLRRIPPPLQPQRQRMWEARPMRLPDRRLSSLIRRR